MVLPFILTRDRTGLKKYWPFSIFQYIITMSTIKASYENACFYLK